MKKNKFIRNGLKLFTTLSLLIPVVGFGLSVPKDVKADTLRIGAQNDVPFLKGVTVSGVKDNGYYTTSVSPKVTITDKKKFSHVGAFSLEKTVYNMSNIPVVERVDFYPGKKITEEGVYLLSYSVYNVNGITHFQYVDFIINKSPSIIAPIGNRYVEKGRFLKVNLNKYFKDGLTDDLKFSVKNSKSSVVETFLDNDNGVLTIKHKKGGISTISVVASDGKLKSKTLTFKVAAQ